MMTNNSAMKANNGLSNSFTYLLISFIKKYLYNGATIIA